VLLLRCFNNRIVPLVAVWKGEIQPRLHAKPNKKRERIDKSPLCRQQQLLQSSAELRLQPATMSPAIAHGEGEGPGGAVIGG
jgi:hypothetical protein